MKDKIYILSGPVRTGKTTRLNRWLKTNKTAAGILAPVIEDIRHLKDIRSGRMRQLEASSSEKIDNPVKIGRFVFKEEVFKWGREALINAVQQKPQWIIVDEIGPLELMGAGLEPAVSEIIEKVNGLNETKVLLVIRDKMLEKVIRHYHLQKKWITKIKHARANWDMPLF